MSTSSAKERLRVARDAMYQTLILDAAEEVFADHGYEAARMQDVATRAGVSTRTVYATFEGKWDLFTAVHERRGRELLAAVADAPHARGPALERLLGGIAAYALHLMRHPSYLRMLGHAKVWTSSKELPSGPQAATSDRGMDMVTRSFAEGVRLGLFREEDPALLARMMHSMHQVRLLDWLERGMREPPEVIARRMQEELVCAFCRPERIAALLAEVLPRVPVEAIPEAPAADVPG
jgi:AcrR family transcriptional regulator